MSQSLWVMLSGLAVAFASSGCNDDTARGCFGITTEATSKATTQATCDATSEILSDASTAASLGGCSADNPAPGFSGTPGLATVPDDVHGPPASQAATVPAELLGEIRVRLGTLVLPLHEDALFAALGLEAWQGSIAISSRGAFDRRFVRYHLRPKARLVAIVDRQHGHLVSEVTCEGSEWLAAPSASSAETASSAGREAGSASSPMRSASP